MVVDDGRGCSNTRSMCVCVRARASVRLCATLMRGQAACGVTLTVKHVAKGTVSEVVAKTGELHAEQIPISHQLSLPCE